MALQEAQQAYRQAEQDPQVTSHAPVALHEAAQALSEAEQAGGQEEIEHMAYIAKKRVEIARAEAERKLAEDNAKQLLEGRDEVIAQQAKARAQELERELAELKAKRTDRGFVITLGDVLFEYNQARLKPGAQQNLYRLVSFLKQRPEQNVLIEGHADSSGSESYNLELSQRRAQAVQSFLVMNGISPERINVRGYGEAYPVASNNTTAGRQQNRRVEIVFGEGPRPTLSGRGKGSAAP
jgi:outer membrane protein OmpA-like peptidoglycan-associated protein